MSAAAAAASISAAARSIRPTRRRRPKRKRRCRRRQPCLRGAEGWHDGPGACCTNASARNKYRMTGGPAPGLVRTTTRPAGREPMTQGTPSATPQPPRDHANSHPASTVPAQSSTFAPRQSPRRTPPAAYLILKLSTNSLLDSMAYSKRVPALIVHSELKSAHPGFPVTFIFLKHKLINK